jgi:hypothetical protein
MEGSRRRRALTESGSGETVGVGQLARIPERFEDLADHLTGGVHVEVARCPAVGQVDDDPSDVDRVDVRRVAVREELAEDQRAGILTDFYRSRISVMDLDGNRSLPCVLLDHGVGFVQRVKANLSRLTLRAYVRLVLFTTHT